MIDLHSHMLPNTDDGPKNMGTSVELAKAAVNNGVTDVLLTPHHMDGQYTNPKEAIIQKTEDFQQTLNNAGVPLSVHPGQEVRINTSLIDALDNDDILFADPSNHYIMLELPHTGIPEYTSNLLYDLKVRNITPIIVHPERNAGFLRHPEKLYEFVSQGALTQITANSYIGEFGKRVQKFTERLIDANLVTTFASDVHNLDSRSYKMKAAYKRLEKRYGKDYADELKDNADKIMQGFALKQSPISEVKKKNKFFGLFK